MGDKIHRWIDESLRSGASPMLFAPDDADPLDAVHAPPPLRPKAPAAKFSPTLDVYDEFQTKYRTDALVSPAMRHDALGPVPVVPVRPRRRPAPVARAPGAKPGDVVRVTRASPRTDAPAFDTYFSPPERKTAGRSRGPPRDAIVEDALKHFDAMAAAGAADVDDEVEEDSDQPLSPPLTAPLSVPDTERGGPLPALQQAVYAQFASDNVDDHTCVGTPRAVFVSVAHDEANTLAYTLFHGVRHADNAVIRLTRAQLTQAARRRTPFSDEALYRRAELTAVCAALRQIVVQPLRRQCVHVCVSSPYIAKAWGVWIPDWETNGWPGESDADSSLGGGSGSSQQTPRRTNSQSSSVRTPNSSLADSELRASAAPLTAELLRTPLRSSHARRTGLASEGDSLRSSFDGPVTPSSGTADSPAARPRRTRRLVDEDLLRELALLRAQLAAADARGGACVHLYLIERVHNPARVSGATTASPVAAAPPRPSSQASMRSSRLRPQRSEPNLGASRAARSPRLDNVRSPAMESVMSPAPEPSPRAARPPRLPRVAASPAATSAPLPEKRSPREPQLERTPRLRQPSTPREPSALATPELPPPAAATDAAAPASPSPRVAPPPAPALTADALLEHTKRTNPTEATPKTRSKYAWSAHSGDRSVSGRSRLARWTNKVLRRSDAPSAAPAMPSPRVDDHTAPGTPRVPEAPAVSAAVTPPEAPAAASPVLASPPTAAAPAHASLAVGGAKASPAPRTNALGIVVGHEAPRIVRTDDNAPPPVRSRPVLRADNAASSPRMRSPPTVSFDIAPPRAASPAPMRRRMPRSIHTAASQPNLRARARADAAPALPADLTWVAPRRAPATGSPVSSPIMTRGTAWLASEERMERRPAPPVATAPWPGTDDEDGLGRAAALATSSYARGARRGPGAYTMLDAQHDESGSDSGLDM
ncbi:hypothetical protein MBRA1_000032 [Malassezia brasiliensis]|uniref:Uncharacterized protein n=1 Tax=Malassezia brasiliensis TaxID=1821822 RepID=A0AAF0DQ97_9BASI|nr:hypothetical protein MBRA1_000032 [Malassezia brasiliensis]